MVVLVGDERDPRLGLATPQQERGLHSADAVADDDVVHPARDQGLRPRLPFIQLSQ